MRAAALLLALLCACPAPASRPPTRAPKPPPAVAIEPPPTGRLGDAVRPTAYALSIELDPQSADYRGEVIIDLAIARPVASIWMNAQGPVVTRAVLELPGAPPRPVTQLLAPKDRGLLGFDLGGTVPAGTATLRLTFTGKMGTEVGLFHQYLHRRWYAFTDFEPIDARRAFPCFDDPRFKTPWTVTLVVPADTRAASNTAVAERRVDGGTQTLRFHTTPPLPSYLVAFADGPFDVVDAGREPMPMRLLVPKGETAAAAHAAAWVERYYTTARTLIGIGAPWHKVDFVAVPVFDGAMENPGLITVARKILLQPEQGDPQGLRMLDLVLAHELVHLWFGDWVTLDYWDDLWLNEGFATYYSDQILRIERPQWKWMLARERVRQGAVAADMKAGARAVHAPVTTEVGLEQRFDATTYLKGGAVLDMLAGWLGPSFGRGVQHYLRAHAWGTVTSADFAHALDVESGQPVSAVMRSYLDQPGLPVITPTVGCDRGHAVIDAVQAPIAWRGVTTGTRTWTLPICVRHDGRRTCKVASATNTRIRLDATCNTPLVVNPDGDVYAVTALSPEAARALAPVATDRDWLHLIESVRARVRAGDLPPSRAMATLAPLSSVALPGPVVSELASLLDELAALSPDPHFADAAWAVAATSVAAIGLDPTAGDSAAEIARPTAITIAAHYAPASAPIAIAARARLDEPFRADTNLEIERVAAQLSLAAAHGGRAVHDKLILRLTTGEGRDRLATAVALAAEQDPALAEQSLGLALTRSPMEGKFLLASALNDPMTRATAWRFVGKHLQNLLEQGRVGGFMASSACTDEQIQIANVILDDALAASSPPANAPLLRARSTMQTCQRLRDHYRVGANARN